MVYRQSEAARNEKLMRFEKNDLMSCKIVIAAHGTSF